MNDPNEAISELYESSCKGKHIPIPEQSLAPSSVNTSGGDPLDMYFSRGKQKAVKPSSTVIPENTIQQPNTELLTEQQQRNRLLSEAAVAISNALQYFHDAEDKKYVKSIREGIEELMD